MSHHWKELLPLDCFFVRSNGIMHDFYRKTLTSLYQPLIGATAYSLYMTLWSWLETDDDWSKSATHRSLMNVTQLDLKQLLLARKKLEGIGLLTTFLKETDGTRNYYYQLEVPMSPEKFFNDGALNVYLYNRLGNYQFFQMKKKFTTVAPAPDMKDVTASFNDVYTSLHPSELMTHEASEIKQAMMLDDGQAYLEEADSPGLRFHQNFDIEWLEQSLSDLIVPKNALTPDMIEAIKKLAYIYSIEPLQMKQILESIFVKHDEIDVETIRKGVQEWYMFQHDNQLPRLSLRKQPPLYREPSLSMPKSDEEKAIQLFETISPYEQLERIAGGAKPAASDLKLIESIMFEQKLNPGVVNVLVEYVMRTNDMKLTKAYVEKLAAHWARKKIKTVKEAMALAKSEHEKYQAWSTVKKRKTQNAQKRYERRDTLPKWMTDNIQEKPLDADFEEKKRALEARLKKYKESD